jgi:hypothetical protein
MKSTPETLVLYLRLPILLWWKPSIQQFCIERNHGRRGPHGFPNRAMLARHYAKSVVLVFFTNLESSGKLSCGHTYYTTQATGVYSCLIEGLVLHYRSERVHRHHYCCDFLKIEAFLVRWFVQYIAFRIRSTRWDASVSLEKRQLVSSQHLQKNLRILTCLHFPILHSAMVAG